jgi:glutathione S-transferase
MANYTLVIGNKKYSSWSLRPWLLLVHGGIAFDEIRIGLRKPDTAERIRAQTPAGRVPVLHAGKLTIWDSLAIAEFLAERHPDSVRWPADLEVRARARSVSAEMHSGFSALRQNMPMHCDASYPGAGRTPEALADIARITEMWNDCRARFGSGGPFLFGAFSIADAMYAPVVFRFRTYGVELDAVCRAYVDTMITLPAMQRWLAEATAETDTIAEYEP